MTKRICIALVLAAGLGAAASATAHASPTRTRLWTAMDRFATCRHTGGEPFHISSATPGTVSYEAGYQDGAMLSVVVHPGHGGRITWRTKHHVRQPVADFTRLRQAAGLLDEATAARGCTA